MVDAANPCTISPPPPPFLSAFPPCSPRAPLSPTCLLAYLHFYIRTCVSLGLPFRFPRGGPLKKTADGRFYAHLSCVIWIPEAHVVDTATMGPVLPHSVCVCVCVCVSIDAAAMGAVARHAGMLQPHELMFAMHVCSNVALHPLDPQP